ncbi:tyrosine-type recombinase/integrase [Ancylobacter pratisalsi]|uniref:Integrase arm-type DNA-binding domain-containing protein n=1 Tax=Ancylobacter pratisalsi TaxID=1745854 RepID=A0A6P1YML4_9HYPH|nr:site-specific integrase [Ancylobacter pratisalsi]QIB34322.1 integrase arm-type DNA-binding domain-containing protein [Ancylobacter pratisalsi]
MAKATKKLSARAVASITDPGRHSDGDGLYLQVTSTGAKSWLFMFKRDGRRSEVGLGSVRDVTLADARQKAVDARKIIDAGKNPLEERRAAEAARKARAEKPTFGQVADNLIESIAAGFRNAKHLDQWRMTLGPTYCSSIRSKPVDAITTEDLLAVLEPIWTKKAETASRLRGRIERVLDAARAKGLRSGENPALWRGHLDSLLPKRQKLQRGHHAAMPYSEVSAFIATLQDSEGVTARALEFLILTASRSGEAREARWGEVDLKAQIWTVPAHRMKAGREHRVPLSVRATTLLAGMKLPGSDIDAFVFPGARNSKPLSVMAFDMQLRRMDCDYTVHGFRSAFRDWVGEETAFPREVAEAALAHTVGDEVERAYRRGDALEKRRKLMEAWASYCAGETAKADQAEPQAEEVADVIGISEEQGEHGVQV